MNILQASMMMEQIDMTHCIMEKLHQPLPYKPYPMATTIAEFKERCVRFQEMDTKIKRQCGYLLNWTRDCSVDAYLQDQVRNDVYDEKLERRNSNNPIDYGDKNWRLYPYDILLHLENNKGKFKLYDTICNNHRRFSWASFPQWCGYHPSIHPKDLHLVLSKMSDYDTSDDEFMPTMRIYLSPNHPEDDASGFLSLLKRANNGANINKYYIFFYTEHGKYMETGRTEIYTNNKEWVKRITELMKDKNSRFVTSQMYDASNYDEETDYVKDEDDYHDYFRDRHGDAAAHFLVHP